MALTLTSSQLKKHCFSQGTVGRSGKGKKGNGGTMGGRKGFYYSTGFGVDVEELDQEPLHIRELGRARVRLLKTLLSACTGLRPTYTVHDYWISHLRNPVLHGIPTLAIHMCLSSSGLPFPSPRSGQPERTGLHATFYPFSPPLPKTDQT